MSLLDEREFYKPFNYAWAYEAYKAQNQMHWIPDEVNLADDLKDFREKLTPDNKLLLTNIFRFFQQAENQGLSGLKGHRSVGGLRASIYNAHPKEGVEALINFMKTFQATNQSKSQVMA